MVIKRGVIDRLAGALCTVLVPLKRSDAPAFQPLCGQVQHELALSTHDTAARSARGYAASMVGFACFLIFQRLTSKRHSLFSLMFLLGICSA